MSSCRMLYPSRVISSSQAGRFWRGGAAIGKPHSELAWGAFGVGDVVSLVSPLTLSP